MTVVKLTTQGVVDVPGAHRRAEAEAVERVGAVLDRAGVPHDDPADLLAALIRLRHVRDELATWEHQLIEAARAAGASWARLAPALGVSSRQAAERRYLRLRPDASGTTSTGEQRVRAERDRRAGRRAVTSWARQHSASLRELAGQVSAVHGVSGAAGDRIRAVRRALAGDDTTALLRPLAEAGPHLQRSHPALAEQITELTDRTDAVRDAGANRG